MKIHFPEARDVKLREVSTRVEFHGDTEVVALDLHIGVTGSNALLDMIHPDLRAMLFKPLEAQPSDGQQEIDLPVDDRPSVRVPLLKMPIAYRFEQVGMTLKVAYGATGKQDMVLGAVKLSKPKVASLIEGGSVELQFTLSTTDVSEKVIGKLSLLQGHEISIVLTAPEVEDVKPDPGNDAAWPFPKDAPAPEQDAGDIFAAEHGGDQEEATEEAAD